MGFAWRQVDLLSWIKYVYHTIMDKKIIWITLTVQRVTTLCLKLMPISLACIKENLALCFLSISLPLLLKIVFCYQNCSDLCTVQGVGSLVLWEKLFWWSRKTFEIQGWRLKIFKIFEITRTIYSKSKRSEQFW